jgi:hypothetical protein
MRNFLMIANGIDFMPVLLEVQRQPELWNRFQVRSFHDRSGVRGLDDIVLRYNRFDEGDDFVDAVCSRIEVVDYPAMRALPMARQMCLAVMAKVQGVHLGRVFVSRIKPGDGIGPHTDHIAPAEEAFPDRIAPAAYYDRYHVPLQSGPGCYFRCGDETVLMSPGQLWWFNNEVEHEVSNQSGHDRMHLVMDIHSALDDYTPIPWSDEAAARAAASDNGLRT